jgi:glycosyltransferase involved in cell wall biosynthesis
LKKKANPKICHIITTFNEKSGSSRRTLDICTALLSKGGEVHLVVGKDTSIELKDICKKKGMKITQINSLVRNVRPYSDLKALIILVMLLRRMKYDIVHTHLDKAGILGRLAAKLARVKIILHTVNGPTIHGELSLGKRVLYTFLERTVARFSTAMIVNGKEIKATYLRLRIGDPNRYRLIYTGRDFSKYIMGKEMQTEEKAAIREKYGIAIDEIVIGYVARVVPSKGHEYAIKVCELLKRKHKKFRFLFVGSANIPSEKRYEMMLRKKVNDHGLNDYIMFLDHKYDIERYYLMFDIFIFPSLYEGLPNVILEAAVMELPIVAFDCDGVKEVVGENEYIVKTKDVSTFTEKLEELIKSAERRKTLLSERKFSVKQLISIWSREKMIRDELNLYEEFFNDKNKTRGMFLYSEN